VFHKKSTPLIFYYTFAKLWTIFIKKLPSSYTLENVFSCNSLLKLLHIHKIFFANNYLISNYQV